MLCRRWPASVVKKKKRPADPCEDEETETLDLDQLGGSLCAGDQSRLHDHLKVAVAAKTPFLCINVRQGVGYHGRASGIVPVLTTKSAIIFGVSLQREAGTRKVSRALTGYEHLAVMGWPLLLPYNHRCSAWLPACLQPSNIMQQPERVPSDSQFRLLAGNMMHTSQVGFVLLFAVLAADRVEPVD